MRTRDALAVVAADFATQRPTPVQIPAFSGLPEDIQDQLRSILEPCQRAGLRIEVDPNIPDTVGILLHGGVYRVSAANSPTTGGMFVAIMGPDLTPWTKDEFLALLPDEAPEPEVAPLRLGDVPPPRRAQADILEELLEEIRGLRADLRAR